MSHDFSPHEITELETLVDRNGLSEMLSALSYICSEKAIHVATSYQDTTLAKWWMEMAKKIDKLTEAARKEHQ